MRFVLGSVEALDNRTLLSFRASSYPRLGACVEILEPGTPTTK